MRTADGTWAITRKLFVTPNVVDRSTPENVDGGRLAAEVRIPWEINFHAFYAPTEPVEIFATVSNFTNHDYPWVGRARRQAAKIHGRFRRKPSRLCLDSSSYFDAVISCKRNERPQQIILSKSHPTGWHQRHIGIQDQVLNKRIPPTRMKQPMQTSQFESCPGRLRGTAVSMRTTPRLDAIEDPAKNQ